MRIDDTHPSGVTGDFTLYIMYMRYVRKLKDYQGMLSGRNLLSFHLTRLKLPMYNFLVFLYYINMDTRG